MILGIDEVGRGSWAGPLVVGAVTLGGISINGLTDSKVLTKKRREQLSEEIMRRASGVGLGWVSAQEIDRVGLSTALCLATQRAVKAVSGPFHEIIIDGKVNFLRSTPLEPHVTLIKKADLLVPSVSAASIVAKVARDRYMADRDEEFMGYGFRQHVGYGTAAHRSAIARLGVCVEHRLSFAPLAAYRRDDGDAAKEVPDPDRGHQRSTTRSVGDLSETAAADELIRRGHDIIARNWRTKYCEIDIVSRRADTYYFVEVKHRQNDRAGDGLTAISPKKLKQMEYAARFYAHVERLSGVDLRLAAIATSGKDYSVDDLVVIV